MGRTWENWGDARRRRERGENNGGENYESYPVQIREVHAEKGVERKWENWREHGRTGEK